MLGTSSATIDDRLQRTSFLPEEKALLKLACAAAFQQFPASDACARMAAVDEVIGVLDAVPDTPFAEILHKAQRALLRFEDAAAPVRRQPKRRARTPAPHETPGSLAA